jgi:hypothetical protein
VRADFRALSRPPHPPAPRQRGDGASGDIAREAREELCPDRHWRLMLVYGNLKYPEELHSIEDCGVEVMHIGKVLEELRDRKRIFVTSSEVSGVAEMFDTFCKEQVN